MVYVLYRLFRVPAMSARTVLDNLLESLNDLKVLFDELALSYAKRIIGVTSGAKAYVNKQINPNHGKRWSENMVRQLLTLYTNGFDYSTIARILQRSERAVTYELQKQISNILVREGMPGVCRTLNKTEDEINTGTNTHLHTLHTYNKKS